jgi:hypothetical protein
MGVVFNVYIQNGDEDNDSPTIGAEIPEDIMNSLVLFCTPDNSLTVQNIIIYPQVSGMGYRSHL